MNNKINKRMNVWKALLRVPLVLGLVIFLAGCILIPLPSKTIDSNITDDELSFLVKDQTSKSEVRANLGEPHAAFQSSSICVYTMRQYLSRLGCIALLQGATCEVDDILSYQVLKIDFDDHGVVSDWSKSSGVEGKCTKRGICRTNARYRLK